MARDSKYKNIGKISQAGENDVIDPISPVAVAAVVPPSEAPVSLVYGDLIKVKLNESYKVTLYLEDKDDPRHKNRIGGPGCSCIQTVRYSPAIKNLIDHAALFVVK